MCVILDRKLGSEIPFEALEMAAKKNPHGWGVAVADRGQLLTFRGLSEKPQQHAEEIAKVLEAAKELPVQIHFRWATAGKKDVSNTHPFELLTLKEHGVDLQIMHNGTIPHFKIEGAPESDTAKFVTKVAAPMFEKWWHWTQAQGGDIGTLLADAALMETLKAFAGYGVFTLLSGTGDSLRVNEFRGKSYDWGWASNDTALSAPKKQESSAGGRVTHYNPSSFRSDSAQTVLPWPPESWKRPSLDTHCLTLREQADELRAMIKESPNNKCVLPAPATRLTSEDFLGNQLKLSDLAYLDWEDLRDLIVECPEAAATCFFDLIQKCYVAEDGKVKPEAPVTILLPAGSHVNAS